MKDVIRLSLIGTAMCVLFAWAMLRTADNSKVSAPLTSEEISWVEFCKARHYDPHTEDEEIINEYLDTWVGSVEEERAFNNLPAQEA